MKGVAVQLDDEVVLRPEAVDHDPVDDDVASRLRQARVADQLEEAALELGLGPGRLFLKLIERARCRGVAPR